VPTLLGVVGGAALLDNRLTTLGQPVSMQVSGVVHQFAGVPRQVVAVKAEVEHPAHHELLLTPDISDATLAIGGIAMTFGPDDNEGLDQVFMTMIQADGKFKAVDKLIRITSN